MMRTVWGSRLLFASRPQVCAHLLQVLLVGGQDDAHDPLHEVEEWDPATGLWATLCELPFHRQCFGVALWVWPTPYN